MRLSAGYRLPNSRCLLRMLIAQLCALHSVLSTQHEHLLSPQSFVFSRGDSGLFGWFGGGSSSMRGGSFPAPARSHSGRAGSPRRFPRGVGAEIELRHGAEGDAGGEEMPQMARVPPERRDRRIPLLLAAERADIDVRVAQIGLVCTSVTLTRSRRNSSRSCRISCATSLRRKSLTCSMRLLDFHLPLRGATSSE